MFARWGLYRSDIGDYMHRWILRTPWFTLRLHHILRSDAGRDFHDHPFSFVSLILWGGYIEHRPPCLCGTGAPDTLCRRFGPGSIVRRRAADLHRLELAAPAWTFVIATPYFRKWGFQTKAGWVPFDEYQGEA